MKLPMWSVRSGRGAENSNGDDMKVRVAAAVLAVIGGLFAGLAAGQDDPIAQRQELMKSLGPYLGAVFRMVRGDNPFDAAVAEEAMLKVVEHAAVLPSLFPEGSQAGSGASELIWEEFDAFVAIYADLEAAGQAGATAAAANDPEGVSAAFSAVGNACGSCHQKYRVSN
jgi:cytochrome c556